MVLYLFILKFKEVLMDNQQVNYQDNKFYQIPVENQYMITTSGAITKIKTQKIIKPFIDKDGYHRVTLCRDGTTKKYYVHRLVAITFLGLPETDNLQVNHKNSIRDCNHYTNLEWVTPKENTYHGILYGNIKIKGEESPVSILTEEEVRNICKKLENGESIIKLSRLLNINKNTIFSIRSGQTWLHVSKDYNIPDKNKYLTEPEVFEICKLLEEGYDDKQILDIYKDLNRHHIGNIRNRKTFRNVSKNFTW